MSRVSNVKRTNRGFALRAAVVGVMTAATLSMSMASNWGWLRTASTSTSSEQSTAATEQESLASALARGGQSSDGAVAAQKEGASSAEAGQQADSGQTDSAVDGTSGSKEGTTDASSSSETNAVNEASDSATGTTDAASSSESDTNDASSTQGESASQAESAATQDGSTSADAASQDGAATGAEQDAAGQADTSEQDAVANEDSPNDKGDSSEQGVSLAATLKGQDGKRYEVTLEAPAEAGIPEDATLEITEINRALTKAEKEDPANANRPVDTERFASKAALAARDTAASQALGLADNDLLVRTKYLDVRVVDANGKRVTLTAPVKLSVTTDAVDASETAAVELAVVSKDAIAAGKEYNAATAEAASATTDDARAKAEKRAAEAQAKLVQDESVWALDVQAEKADAGVSIATTTDAVGAGELALAVAAAPVVSWENRGTAVTVYAARDGLGKVRTDDAAAPALGEDQELLDSFSVRADKAGTDGVTMWLVAESPEAGEKAEAAGTGDAAETAAADAADNATSATTEATEAANADAADATAQGGHVAGYLTRNGEVELEAFGAAGTAEPVAFRADEQDIALVWEADKASAQGDDTVEGDASNESDPSATSDGQDFDPPASSEPEQGADDGFATDGSAGEDGASADDAANGNDAADAPKPESVDAADAADPESTEAPVAPVQHGTLVAPTTEPRTLTATDDANTYTVTATFGPESGLPVDARLSVRELSTAEQLAYRMRAGEAIDASANRMRAFDITFTDAEGRELEPTGPVDVRIELREANASSDGSQQLLHFSDDPAESAELVSADSTATSDGLTLDFTSSSFSVYAVAYTVDFHFDTYEYSMEGTTSMLLSALFERLGIDNITMADVASVAFSDPALVQVERMAGTPADWRLTSLQPFQTQESLTITLVNGQSFVIAVTDAAAKASTVKNPTVSIKTAGVTNQYQSNLTFATYADGTAVATGKAVTTAGTHYYIPNTLTANGYTYQVIGTTLAPGAISGNYLIFDDDLVVNMLEAAPMEYLETVVSDMESVLTAEEQAELAAMKAGEHNSGDGAVVNKLFKSATYDETTNSILITLKYFQTMKRDVPLDFIFCLDDSGTMGSIAYNSNKNAFTMPDGTSKAAGAIKFRATQSVWCRVVLQAVLQTIMEWEGDATTKATASNPDAITGDSARQKGYDIRVATIAFSSAAVSGTFKDNYADAKEEISRIYTSGGTKHSATVAAMGALADKSIDASRYPIVVYLSDFHSNANTKDCKTAMATFRQKRNKDNEQIPVYTLHMFESDYKYDRNIASSSDKMYLLKDTQPIGDMLGIFQTITKDAIGYYVGKDTTVQDGISDGLKAVAKSYEVQGSDGAVSKSGDTYSWAFTDSDGEKLQAGRLYTRTIQVQLKDDVVFSPSMAANSGAQVVKTTEDEDGNTTSKTVNQITDQPLPKSETRLVLGLLDENGSKTSNVITGQTIEIYAGTSASGTPLWSGTTSTVTNSEQGISTGEVVIPSTSVPFGPGATYTLKQVETNTDIAVMPSPNTWKLVVGANGVIDFSQSSGTDQPAMTASAGKLRLWNKAKANTMTPLVPVVVQKAWSGYVPQAGDTVPFTVLGNDGQGGTVELPAYDTNDRTVADFESHKVEQLTYENVDSKTDALWTKTVYVPAWSGEGTTRITFFDTSATRNQYNPGYTIAEGEMSLLAGTGDWTTTVDTTGKQAGSDYTYYTYTGQEGTFDVTADSWTTYKLYLDFADGYAESNVYRNAVTSEDDNRADRVSAFNAFESACKAATSASITLDYVENGTSLASTLAINFSNGIDGYVTFYQIKLPQSWSIISVKKIESNGYAWHDSENMVSWLEGGPTLTASTDNLNSGSHYRKVSSQTLTHEEHVTRVSHEISSLARQILKLTNAFTPSYKLAVSSTWDDDPAIASVTYAITKDGAAYDTITVAKGTTETLKVPAGTYTVTQTAYTLPNGKSVAATNGQFAAYSTDEATKTVSFSSSDAAGTQKSAAFVNTRKKLTARVVVTWPDTAEYGDILYNDSIPYDFSYTVFEANKLQKSTTSGSVAGTSWENSHADIPTYGIDGTDTELVLTLPDNNTLAQYYDTEIVRTVDDAASTVIFTIANTLKSGMVGITKLWELEALPVGQTAPTSVTVQVKSDDNKITREVTLNDDNSWTTQVKLPVGKVYTVTETAIDSTAPADQSTYGVTYQTDQRLDPANSTTVTTKTGIAPIALAALSEVGAEVTITNSYYICKVVDASGTEHPFTSLRAALLYAREKGLTTASGGATIQMLVDYTMPEEDALDGSETVSGHTINYYVQSGESLTITTAAKTGGTYNYRGTGEVATITRNFDGGTLVRTKGTLTLGAITLDGAKDAHTGGVAQEDGGVAGGLVYADENATLELVADGALAPTLINSKLSTPEGDSAAKGGAVYLGTGATFSQAAGTISNNEAAIGAGVYVNEDATAAMSGGSMTGNVATSKGSAVYVAKKGTFEMNGGRVTGNDSAKGAIRTGGGTEAGSCAVLRFSGDAYVYDNMNGSDQMNLYLDADSNAIVNTTGTGLTTAARIGVFVNNAQLNAHGVAGTPFGTYAEGADANLSAFVNDRTPGLTGVKGTTDGQIAWPFYIARVSNDDGATWTYHEWLIDSTAKTDEPAVKVGAFDQAQSLGGTVVVETLMETATAPSSTTDRYALTQGFTFNKANLDVTLRTTQDTAWNPEGKDHFTSVITRGFDGGADAAKALLYLNKASAQLTTQVLTFDGKEGETQHTGRAIYANAGASVAIGSGCTFRNFSTDGNGAAVYANTQRLSVAGSAFTACEATNGSGGAIYHAQLRGATNRVTSCSFTRCTATGNGGGLYFAGLSHLEKDVSFANCSAANGGGVYAGKAVAVTGEASFDSCTASGAGGAIYDGGFFYLSRDVANSEPEETETGRTDSKLGWTCDSAYFVGEAGVIATISERPYTKSNAIPAIGFVRRGSDNWWQPALLSTDPGALTYTTNYDDSTWAYTVAFEYEGLTWYYFRGSYGFQGNPSRTSSLPTCDFSTGSWGDVAEGIAVLQAAHVQASTPDTASSRLSVTNCSAKGGDGGGIYAGNVSALLANLNMENCVASASGGGLFANNALAIGRDVVLAAKACTAASDGGAVFKSGSGVFTINPGVSFVIGGTASGEECTAGRHGGGVYSGVNIMPTSGDVSFTITNCTAGSNGGGVYSAGELTIGSGSSITGCRATNGGGVFSNGRNLNLNGCAFTGCSATTNGGAAYATNGVTITGDVSITDSVAASNGGALYDAGQCVLGVHVPASAPAADNGQVDSKLGWKCDERYFVGAAGTFANISDRDYYKANAVPAIGFIRKTCPALISTDPTAVVYSTPYDGSTWAYSGTFEYEGLTWYYFQGSYGFSSPRINSDLPVYDFSAVNNVEIEGKQVLEDAHVQASEANLRKTTLNITGCQATNDCGGGMRVNGTSRLMGELVIGDCSAKNDGGGLYAGGVAIMQDATITRSHADRNGGGAYFANTSDLTDVSMQGCYATANGGGMYLGNKAELTNTVVEGSGLPSGVTANAKLGSAFYGNADVVIRQSGSGKTEITGNAASEAKGGAINMAFGKSVTFEGDVVVKDNTCAADESCDHDVVLGENNDQRIKTTDTGLGEDAEIWVYVTDTDPYKNHGKQCQTFGLATGSGNSEVNLDKFHNDRDTSLFGVSDVEMGKAETDNKIYWGHYICKIVTGDGEEHIFPSLNGAVKFARESMEDNKGEGEGTNGTATIQMLVDYEVPSLDKVTLDQAGDDISMTTAKTKSEAQAAGETWYFSPTFDEDEDTRTVAILMRGWNGNADAAQALFYVNNASARLTTQVLTFDGGAVYADDGDGTYTITGYSGRAIYNNAGALVVKGASTFRNFRTHGDGGVIYDKGADTTIGELEGEKVAFDHCGCSNGSTVGGKGGAVFSYATGNATFANCSFDVCIANGGGGVYFPGVSNTQRIVSFTKCDFADCSLIGGGTSDAHGAAICENSGSGTIAAKETYISQCTFTNLITPNWGGALLLRSSSKVEIADSEFTNCHCNANHGGAVYIQAEANVQSTLERCSFKDCYAANGVGGAVYVGNNTNAKSLTVSGCSFESCGVDGLGTITSTGGGAIDARAVALSIQASSAPDTAVATGTAKGLDARTAITSSFINCSCSGQGGAVSGNCSAAGSSMTVSDSSFENCTNTNGDGGCLYTAAYAVSLADSNFTNSRSNGRRGGTVCQNQSNAAASFEMSNCKVQGSSAGAEGGVVYTLAKDHVTISDCSIDGLGSTFKDAATTANATTGGAIHAAGATSIRIANSTIKNFKSSSWGGGVYATGTKLEIVGTTIQSCSTASNGGGGVCAKMETSIEDSTIADNTAYAAGGGIYSEKALAISGKSAITGNKAGTLGGAIWIGNNLVLNVAGATITGNAAAADNGGAINTGGTGAKLFFSGNAKVYNNPDGNEGTQQKNVVLSNNNNTTIQTSEAGLGAGAQIGVYVVGTDTTDPYKTHGYREDDFGTYASSGDGAANLGKFVNDRDTKLFGAVDANSLICWSGGPVCKLTTSSDTAADSDILLYVDASCAVPAVYSKLSSGFAATSGELYYKDGDKVVAYAATEPIKLKMLQDLTLKAQVAYSQARELTFTTAENSAAASTLADGDTYLFATERTEDADRALLDKVATMNADMFNITSSQPFACTDLIFHGVKNGSSNQVGRALYHNSTADLTLENLTFGALNAEGKQVADRIQLGAEHVDTDVIFLNNSASGGAVWSKCNGKATVAGCQFYGCKTTGYNHAGAALYFDDNQTNREIEVRDSDFISCSAANTYGSAICDSYGNKYSKSSLVENCVFTDSSSNDYGAVMLRSSQTTVADCSFVDCSSNIKTGGAAMYVGTDNADGSYVHILRTEFSGCHSKDHGAVYVYSATKEVTVEGCSFDGCYGNAGGALYLVANAPLQVKASAAPSQAVTAGTAKGKATGTEILATFTDCHAVSGNGGAICANAALSVSGASFDGCYVQANGEGGAIWANSTADVTDASFAGCYVPSGKNGGALRLNNAATLNNVTIGGTLPATATATANAALGSAVYSSGNLSITGGTIENCVASAADGGAVNMASGKSVTFEGNVVMRSNTNSTSDTSYEHNVVLEANNSTTILTSTAGLGAGANIGVYVLGTDTANPYKTHGSADCPFGTWNTVNANLNKFHNDRNGLVGTSKDGDTLIYWKGKSVVVRLTSNAAKTTPLANAAFELRGTVGSKSDVLLWAGVTDESGKVEIPFVRTEAAFTPSEATPTGGGAKFATGSTYTLVQTASTEGYVRPGGSWTVTSAASGLTVTTNASPEGTNRTLDAGTLGASTNDTLATIPLYNDVSPQVTYYYRDSTGDTTTVTVPFSPEGVEAEVVLPGAGGRTKKDASGNDLILASWGDKEDGSGSVYLVNSGFAVYAKGTADTPDTFVLYGNWIEPPELVPLHLVKSWDSNINWNDSFYHQQLAANPSIPFTVYGVRDNGERVQLRAFADEGGATPVTSLDASAVIAGTASTVEADVYVLRAADSNAFASYEVEEHAYDSTKVCDLAVISNTAGTGEWDIIDEAYQNETTTYKDVTYPLTPTSEPYRLYTGKNGTSRVQMDLVMQPKKHINNIDSMIIEYTVLHQGKLYTFNTIIGFNGLKDLDNGQGTTSTKHVYQLKLATIGGNKRPTLTRLWIRTQGQDYKEYGFNKSEYFNSASIEGNGGIVVTKSTDLDMSASGVELTYRTYSTLPRELSFTNTFLKKDTSLVVTKGWDGVDDPSALEVTYDLYHVTAKTDSWGQTGTNVAMPQALVIDVKWPLDDYRVQVDGNDTRLQIPMGAVQRFFAYEHDGKTDYYFIARDNINLSSGESTSVEQLVASNYLIKYTGRVWGVDDVSGTATQGHLSSMVYGDLLYFDGAYYICRVNGPVNDAFRRNNESESWQLNSGKVGMSNDLAPVVAGDASSGSSGSSEGVVVKSYTTQDEAEAEMDVEEALGYHVERYAVAEGAGADGSYTLRASDSWQHVFYGLPEGVYYAVETGVRDTTAAEGSQDVFDQFTPTYAYDQDGKTCVITNGPSGGAWVILRKVNGDGQPLGGAKFDLLNASRASVVKVDGEELKDLMSDDTGVIWVGELSQGTYWLHEKVAPTKEGGKDTSAYSGNADKYFKVTVEKEVVNGTETGQMKVTISAGT